MCPFDARMKPAGAADEMFSCTRSDVAGAGGGVQVLQIGSPTINVLER
jgi:hypothetical protein